MAAMLGALFFSCNSPSSESDGQDTTTAMNTANTEEAWEPLLQGDTKEGWHQLNGQATYEIKDGVVIGTTKLGEPNSFLATNKEYGDFILEYEVMVDPRMNSGVQIRSHAYEQDTTLQIKNSEGEVNESQQKKGRVYGYQVEIDPSDRGWSGGIYDEARRGWLTDLTGEEHAEARKAFKNGEWNQYRVEAKGDTIRTWVNGVPVTNLVDTMTSSGFIALQVHSTEEEEPMQVQWRNIRIQELK